MDRTRHGMFDSAAFDLNGFTITPPMFDGPALELLRTAAGELFKTSGRSGAGIRDVVSASPACREAAESQPVRGLVEPVLGDGAFLVRSILFDKTPDANWDVVWHQDVTIAVVGRDDVEGFGPWSMKAGVPHVQPPAGVLERMLTLRLHLDACDADNGPLRVVPGSHRRGITNVRTLDTAACDRSAFACHVPAGATLLMRPLILHSSRKAASPSHRRVLHLEFAADALPHPLRWRTV
jgi:ectoine hydroxylase-related dioxygenase (phytanoyl-CoA dioxygenase family)